MLGKGFRQIIQVGFFSSQSISRWASKKPLSTTKIKRINIISSTKFHDKNTCLKCQFSLKNYKNKEISLVDRLVKSRITDLSCETLCLE